MNERSRASRFDCPLCDGQLETWTRERLQVDFCNGCAALFLDRGELFDLFRSEGYDCPPEAHLRFEFASHGGDPLTCPKCAKDTLMPGTLQGLDIWHCTPCNGFLAERGLLLGASRARDVPLHLSGFQRAGSPPESRKASAESLFVRTLQRLHLWPGRSAGA